MVDNAKLMAINARLMAEIAAALQANNKQQLRELKSQLGRNAWLKAWKEKGGHVKDFLEGGNTFVEFED